jgi:P-type Cu2+ transporter
VEGQGASTGAGADAEIERLLAGGATPVGVAVNGAIVSVAGFGDPLRREAAAAVDALRAGGWRVGILSGDHPRVVAAIGRSLDVPPEECLGGVLPERKLEVVRQSLASGTVVMVGDGVNDAAALSAASVGVGVHGGAEASLAAADVFSSRPGLDPLLALFEGSRRTMRVIRRNLVFSLAYNVVGVGLAAAGFINPLTAAILMPVSSLTVIVNSYRARMFVPRTGREVTR